MYSGLYLWRANHVVNNEDVEITGLRSAAEYICVAARTAPKGKGKDLLVIALVTDEEKSRLSSLSDNQ